jgi:hypothetical protein
LEHEIHQVIPLERKHYDNSFRRHKRQLFHEVGTSETSPRSTFANKLAQLNTAAQEEIYRAANMIANNLVEFQVHPSDADSEAISLCITDTYHVTNQQPKEIYCIASNKQICFRKELSIPLFEFEAWSKTICV